MKNKFNVEDYTYRCVCGAYFEEPNNDQSCPICGGFEWGNSDKIDRDIKIVEYRGNKYILLGLNVRHKEYYPEGAFLYVAPESFGSLMEKNSVGWNPAKDKEAVEIDEMIYHYIPDEVFETKNRKEIAEKYLDEPMELIEDG